MIQGGESKLIKLHPPLVRVVRLVATVWDIIILETERAHERQVELVRIGASKTLESKHLIQPDGYAHAVDLTPMPVDWNDLSRWSYFGGYCLMAARSLGIPMTWGGDWNNNTRVKDQTFNDLDHLETP